jgi:hypothetical protein
VKRVCVSPRHLVICASAITEPRMAGYQRWKTSSSSHIGSGGKTKTTRDEAEIKHGSRRSVVISLS